MNKNGNGGEHTDASSTDDKPESLTLERLDGPASLEAVQSMCMTSLAKLAILEREFARLTDYTEESRRLRDALLNTVNNITPIANGLQKALERLERLASSFPKP